MKVVKASIDLAAWKIEQTCTGCQSIFELVSKDIYYNYTLVKTMASWRATCCLCQTSIYLMEKDFSKIVQADICKNRYVSNPSSDL